MTLIHEGPHNQVNIVEEREQDAPAKIGDIVLELLILSFPVLCSEDSEELCGLVRKPHELCLILFYFLCTHTNHENVNLCTQVTFMRILT